MGFILALPEYGLVVDPLVGVLSSAGESLQPVIDKVAVLETVADDLVNMLSGEGNFLSSFPGREKVLPVAGGISAFWYGLAVGLFIAGVVALQFVR
ncbi:MAG TPA: tetrahydromethanopterin S-methyltransferase subunit B [Methanomicrobiales archaeon]|nr:tetrahydromethanopterin S-methyltransferase subunit B [Methanomicrobiales archaeon]